MKSLNIFLIFFAGWVVACNEQQDYEQANATNDPPVEIQTQAFKDYWYAGEAELSHYDLQQIRYGEVRDGDAILVFVTEPFLTNKQVKLESEAEGREVQTVLKLNFLKEFVTGIYKYNVMTSTFTPVNANQYPRSLKVASSSQEWCGLTYSQLNLRGGKYRVTGHSYFEGEADYLVTLDATWLEDEIWTQLRLSPQLLPEGEISIVPGSFANRTSHTAWAVEKAIATKEKWTGDGMPGDSLRAYTVDYVDRNRKLIIVYESEAPYRIAGWIQSQQTRNGETLEARSVRTSIITEPYWQLNSNSDESYRKKLGLRSPSSLDYSEQVKGEISETGKGDDL